MPRRLLFDVTRLLQRHSRAAPTGIDRVIHAYARWLSGRADLEVIPVAIVAGRLAAAPASRLAWPPAKAEPGPAGPSPLLERLAARLAWDSPTGEGLRSPPRDPRDEGRESFRALSDVYLKGLGKRPPKGDTYLNVSHSGLEQPEILSRLKADGHEVAVMLHDLIPLTHPEYCGPGADKRHEQRVRAALDHATVILTNSRSTADDLEAYAHRVGRSLPAVAALPLGVEGAFATPRQPEGGLRDYFVFVGTIEARKNLAFLLTLWRRLAETMGEQTPSLVIVGRRGWENEAVIDHLERSAAVRSRVHEVCDLPDEDLAWLMSGAKALLGPSLAEGYDLPVMEALALGTPVIASDIPVHRELAAGAILVDPLDGPRWLEVISEAARSGLARPAPSPPSWDDHFRGVAAALGLEDATP